MPVPPAAHLSPARSPTDDDVLNTTRLKVRDLLTRSAAFNALNPDQQREIARNTVEVLRYLAAPEGIPGHQLAARHRTRRPPAPPFIRPPRHGTGVTRALAGQETSQNGGTNVNEEGRFVAQGAREGAAVAGALLQAVNFPDFVSGLIHGVFHSIVDSSIKQMEAYGKLVADVAKSLNQFKDENVTVNQGRDHLVEQFPEMFQIDVDTGSLDGPGPRVRLRDGIDESQALQKVNSLPLAGGPLKSLDLEDPETEERLVEAARTQLATSRQQLLATMVLMGINRIVVTDGRISAKVLYDFTAKDNFRFQRSATKFDYGDQMKTTTEGAIDSGSGGYERTTQGLDVTERNAGYYTKGNYRTSSEPVLKLVSASQQSSDATLSTKASLAGQVEVNFKSETFPLEKMADSFQIGMIQNASKPGARPAPSTTGNAAPAPPPSGTPNPSPPVAQS